MDAGTAAVVASALSATIAGATGVGATHLANRAADKQARLQARLHLREPRSKTYSGFIQTCQIVEKDLHRAWVQHQEGVPTSVIGDALGERRATLQNDLSRVALEGPDAVVEAAERVMSALADIDSTVVIRSSPVLRRDEPMSYDLYFAFQRQRKNFIVAARKATDAGTD